MKNRYLPACAAALATLLMSAPAGLQAQTAPAKTPPKTADEEEVIILSPFEVSSSATTGYSAATTLAGNRLATELRDIGNAVTVITAEFIKDIGATDNKSLLQYTTNSEVGGFYGNFAGFGDGSHLDESTKFTNPNQNTRIRGLTAADNTRDFFLTDIPWEGYNVDGVDLQRGPNSILFGQGSPAGIINTRTKQAKFRDSNEVSFRASSFGGTRASVDINKVLIKDELALRLAAVRNDEKYKQDPAFSLQKRIYGAVRWEPGFMKKGSARTIFKANIEFGDIDSNNPRQLPPTDRITPWWYTGSYAGRNLIGQPTTYNNLNKATPTSWEMEDDNTGLANHGWDRGSHNGPSGNYMVNGTNLLLPKYVNDPNHNYDSGSFSGGPNEYYQPWITGSMLGVFGSPAYNYQYNNATQPAVGINWEPSSNHGMTAAGVNGAGTGILPYLRQASINTYSSYAQNARLYYGNLPAWQYGVYKDKSITDPSVFDFYNHLLDGPTKMEYQNFRTWNVSWAQTFLNDHLGWEATYNREWYKSGRTSLIADSLNIDIAKVYNDGSPQGKNGVPFDDSTPNPNLGKPYVGGSGTFGNNREITDREDMRVTAFADYDFSEHHNNWIGRLLGRHVITGLLSKDQVNKNNLDFARYSVDDPVWERVVNSQATDVLNNRTSWMDGRMQPFTFIYLGDSLSGRSSPAGSYIPNVQISPALKSAKVINFDATWKPSTNPADAGYVNPGAVWYNDYYPVQNPVAVDGVWRNNDGAPINSPGVNTQSNNPANYVGFRPYNINIIDSLDSEKNLLRNTHDARLTQSRVFSRAFNWQAHFWDNFVVGTFGVRKDMAKSWAYSLNTNSDSSTKANYQRLDLSENNYRLPATVDNSLAVTSHAYTAVAHLNQLSFLKKLPIQVSLFYNHSTDFQPEAKRVDVYGVPLAAPSGKTKDVGILLETQNGKYSLKVNKYTTNSAGASSSALSNAWFIGSSQAWAANWVNRFEFNWKNDTISDAANPATDADYATNSLYNYGTAPGETQADADKREASVISAWRAWQKSVDPRFYSAWGLNLNDKTKSVNSTAPNGFTVTEDSSSQGYEIEFNASPVRNWRLTLNASETTAQRSNIGGDNLRAFMAAYTKALNTPGAGYTGVKGGVGDLRIWWGGAGNTTTLLDWNGGIGSEFNQRKLQEGTNVPELRKWRWNAISNYEFDRSFLKGFNVGAGVRYESDIVIGYKPIAGTPPNDLTFDIGNPYKGPSETNYDVWFGYTRKKIWRDIEWNIQLNVRNVGVGNELIPITTEPDGSPATYRIRAPQTWALTNTFRF